MSLITTREATACRAIIREKSGTFYLGTRFLPARERHATWVLYAFCRTVDDIADEPRQRSAASEREQDLWAWAAWLEGAGPAPEPSVVSLPLQRVVAEYEVPTRYALELIEGLTEDLEPRRLATEAQLQRYCYQVASTVGLMMIHILGYRHPAAPALAVELGAAMQMTNILRDVATDAAQERRYVPDQLLEEVGCALEEFERGEVTAGVRRAIRRMAAQAEERYRRARRLPACLPARNRLALALAAAAYAGILTDIRRHHHDVFSRRAHLSTARKLLLLPRATWQACRPAPGSWLPALRERGGRKQEPWRKERGY